MKAVEWGIRNAGILSTISCVNSLSELWEKITLMKIEGHMGANQRHVINARVTSINTALPHPETRKRKP